MCSYIEVMVMQINVLPVLGLAGCHLRKGIYEAASEVLELDLEVLEVDELEVLLLVKLVMCLR